MPPKIKAFLNIVAKNAVNALIVNTSAWLILPANFNFHNKAAIWNIAKLALGTVVGREIVVWGPVVLKWSSTDATPNDLEQNLNIASQATQRAAAANQTAAAAIESAKKES